MTAKRPACIEPRMTVLDIISKHRQTEAVFKRWDRQAGACICCQALFDSLLQVSSRYKLDLDRLLADLDAVVGQDDACD